MINLEINMKIKKLFVNLMILLIGNYQNYYKNNVFDSGSYISGTKYSNRPFYRRFVQTQMFNSFLKDSEVNDSVEINEFKNYMNIINSSKENLRSYEDSRITEKDKELIIMSSSEHNLPEQLNTEEKQLKLKALTFKQNREIQNMLEIFNDSDDSEGSFEDNKGNSIIKVAFINNNLMTKQKQIHSYNSNININLSESKGNPRLLKRDGFSMSYNQGRQRCDSGKLESKNSREHSSYSTEKIMKKQSPSGRSSKPYLNKEKQLSMHAGSPFMLQKLNYISKVKDPSSRTHDSSKSLKDLQKNKIGEKGKNQDFRKQIYASLIPKVEVDVVASLDGNASVNLSTGSKNSISRTAYKKNKSVFERHSHKINQKPLEFIKK